MKKILLFSLFIVLIGSLFSFIGAEGNSTSSACDENNVSKNYCKDSKTLMMCAVAMNMGTGQELYGWIEERCEYGCENGLCFSGGGAQPKEVSDMDTCLDDADDYWDQETDECYVGYSDEPLFLKKMCSDPDEGKNIYEQAHTFGFRSYSSADDPSRDLRIRTGGKDGCTSDTQLIENYCDENGYIQTAYIDCPNGCEKEKGRCIKGESINEKITCNFKNSKNEQECYLAGQFGPEDEGTKFCNGKEKCVIDFKGYEGEEITWKSSCGNYQYTTQDGNDEKIEFDCEAGETTITKIKNKGFKFANWKCQNGEEKKSEDKTSCKSSETWQKYAKEFCEGKCNEEGKCGTSYFSVWNECYLDLEDFPIVEEVEPGLNETGIELICKDSCPLGDKCYPFGYRKDGKYCTDEIGFVDYMSAGDSCDNNFECESNVCVDGECISSGFLRKMMEWFRRLFGGD